MSESSNNSSTEKIALVETVTKENDVEGWMHVISVWKRNEWREVIADLIERNPISSASETSNDLVAIARRLYADKQKSKPGVSAKPPKKSGDVTQDTQDIQTPKDKQEIQRQTTGGGAASLEDDEAGQTENGNARAKWFADFVGRPFAQSRRQHANSPIVRTMMYGMIRYFGSRGYCVGIRKCNLISPIQREH